MAATEIKLFDAQQVARMLGVNPVTVRRWRTKNKAAGCIKYGPPYEYHGANVMYPAPAFSAWCSQVRMVGGVPRINLPISASVNLPQRVALEAGDVA